MVVHQLLVQLLELLERVLVVLTGAFGQDVHPEVGIVNLLLVLFLVVVRELVTLALEFLIGLLQVLLLLVEAALNDCRPRQQALLKTPERLVLDLDGGLFLQDLVGAEAALF